MILAIAGDGTFCMLAGRIRPYIVGVRYAALRHKISGTCLLACGWDSPWCGGPKSAVY